jgi:hypothetical protein
MPVPPDTVVPVLSGSAIPVLPGTAFGLSCGAEPALSCANAGLVINTSAHVASNALIERSFITPPVTATDRASTIRHARRFRHDQGDRDRFEWYFPF